MRHKVSTLATLFFGGCTLDVLSDRTVSVRGADGRVDEQYSADLTTALRSSLRHRGAVEAAERLFNHERIEIWEV